MNGKRFSEKKSRKNGFYLALAVCLVAVGIAAWSTYDAVHSYVAPQGESSSAQEMDDTEPDSDIDLEDPTALKKSTATPKPAKQTVGEVTSKAEEKKISSEKPESTPSAAAEPESEADPEPEEIIDEPQVPVNAPIYEISEEMMYPVASEQVTKAYSAGAPVYSQTMKDWRVHCGTDFAAEPDEQVCACANGLVKSAYTDSMLGNVLIIEHGDYEFYYCGLGENFLAAEGDIVTKGQAVGNVTAVPGESAEDTHLHIEVKRDGVYLNPEEVLSGRE